LSAFVEFSVIADRFLFPAFAFIFLKLIFIVVNSFLRQCQTGEVEYFLGVTLLPFSLVYLVSSYVIDMRVRQRLRFGIDWTLMPGSARELFPFRNMAFFFFYVKLSLPLPYSIAPHFSPPFSVSKTFWYFWLRFPEKCPFEEGTLGQAPDTPNLLSFVLPFRSYCAAISSIIFLVTDDELEAWFADSSVQYVVEPEDRRFADRLFLALPHKLKGNCLLSREGLGRFPAALRRRYP